MDSESSTKFIGSLTKFLQSLCNGYVEFDDGVELIGHIYLSVDAGKTGKTLNYFLNEKVCKNDNSVTFISNSFHAQPESKSKGKDGENRKEDGDVSDSGDNIPRSTNAGTVSFRPQGSSRSGASPNQNRTGIPIGTKRPGSPMKGPPSQRRAPTPPSQRRFPSSGPRGTVGSPVSKTVPSSPSSSSQDNAPSPSPARKSRNEISQPTSNQSDNVNADNENDIVPPNVLSINPTPEFASFLGSLTSDNQTSQDQHSPPDTKPDTDVTFIKEEFVSEPSSCAQAGSSGQHSGRSGEDSSGLYPVMLHQNTSVFPSTSGGFPGYQGGVSSTATSQQPGFPGSSSSQSDPFNPVPGTSQDGADPSGLADLEDGSGGYMFFVRQRRSRRDNVLQTSSSGPRRGRCRICSWKKDKKTTLKCVSCGLFACSEHIDPYGVCDRCSYHRNFNVTTNTSVSGSDHGFQQRPPNFDVERTGGNSNVMTNTNVYRSDHGSQQHLPHFKVELSERTSGNSSIVTNTSVYSPDRGTEQSPPHTKVERLSGDFFSVSSL